MSRTLSDEQVERFVTEGYVRVDEAFPRELADTCRDLLWTSTGVDRDDRSTWTEPVVRVWDQPEEPFLRAGSTPRLCDAYDQLVGAGRWVPPASLGTFPVRFPLGVDPGDMSWHIDGSYRPNDDPFYWINVSSRERALLMLFLFSDTGPEDAPTRIKVGSHLAIPPLLEPAGETGLNLFDLVPGFNKGEQVQYPEVVADGPAGTVYLCHPFLVHRTQIHHGTEPRFMGQPPLIPSYGN